jgi:hypothetical protein
VLCFAELGLPAFCVWIALLILCLMELRQVRMMKVTLPEHLQLQQYARAIELGFYGFLTSAWFLSRTYVLTLYLLVALGAAAAVIARKLETPVRRVELSRVARVSVFASCGVLVMIYMTIKASIR